MTGSVSLIRVFLKGFDLVFHRLDYLEIMLPKGQKSRAGQTLANKGTQKDQDGVKIFHTGPRYMVEYVPKDMIYICTQSRQTEPRECSLRYREKKLEREPACSLDFSSNFEKYVYYGTTFALY